MTTLKHIAPALVAQLTDALLRQQRPDLAEQLTHVAVQRLAFGEEDLGYIYFARTAPSPIFANLAAPVAKTISFYDELGLNVDVDHDGHLFGVEFIGRSDITVMLKAVDVL